MKNRMAKGKRLGILLAIALAVLLLVTACAAPTTPDTGKKVVEIGAIPCLTGGGGSADQPAFRAMEDYIRYFNEEQRIPGVTLELVWRDNQTQIPAFISAYRSFVDRGVPVIFSNYPTPLEGLMPQLEKDQTPFVTGGATGPLVVPPGWVFAAWPTQGEAATVLLDYFMESWTEERPPKLQLFVLDETYGRSPAAEATPYAESIGYEVLPLEVCPHLVIDATVQLLRIREREADLVYIQHMNPTAAAGPIMRDVERLGLQDKMQFAGNEWTMGEGLIAMSPIAVENYLSPRGCPWYDETEIPGVKALLDKQMEYHGEVRCLLYTSPSPRDRS